ncbi:MAG: hypothetical protein GX055_10700 [Desulfovibrionales bacterium]|nr:hypothetical protein [Desulfovibrionales bacterium]
MRFREQSFAAALEICSENEKAQVVHAWIPGGSGFVVHAWAEIEDAVYDLTQTNDPLVRTEYYEQHNVHEALVRRYDRVEFFTLVAETGSFGPFDRDFFFANEVSADVLQQKIEHT